MHFDGSGKQYVGRQHATGRCDAATASSGCFKPDSPLVLSPVITHGFPSSEPKFSAEEKAHLSDKMFYSAMIGALANEIWNKRTRAKPKPIIFGQAIDNKPA